MKKNSTTTVAIETDELSLDRIWVHRSIASMWFNDNDSKEKNSITQTELFLAGAKDKSWKGKYVDVTVRPMVTEGDECSLGSAYLVVEGWRQETDAEYQKRLESMLNREKHEKKMFDMKKAYFDNNSIDKKYWPGHDKEQGEFGLGSAHEKRMAELESALKKI